METKANYTLIGAFTLGIVASAFLFVFWFSGTRDEHRNLFSVIFSGSVSGLSRGSQVLFNGLRVGEVTAIDIMESDPSRVEALISISPRAKVTSDTRARLEFQGLTGVAAIALTGGSATAEDLKLVPGTSRPIIFAERSDLQNLLESVQRLSAKADSIMEKAEVLLGANADVITQAVANAQTFTKALSDNAPGVSAFLASMSEVGRTLAPLSVKLEALSGDIDTLVKSVEPERVRATVANIEKVTGVLAGNEANINAVLSEAAGAAKALNASSAKLDGALASAQDVLKAIDPARLSAAVDGVARISASGAKVFEAVDPVRVAALVANADQFAAALGKNAAGIDALLADAAGAAKQLNAASGKLDTVLAGAGATLAALDAGKIRGAIDGFNEAAASAAKITGAVDPDKVRNMVEAASAFADVLEKNQANINNLLADAALAAKTLGASSGKLDGVLTSAGDALKAIDAAKVRSALDDLGKAAASSAAITAAIDPAQLRAMLDSASGFTGVLDRNQANINSLLADAAAAAKTLSVSSGKLDGVLSGAGDVLKGFDAAKISGAVDNVARFTDTLDANRGNIDVMLRDASALAVKLNASADKIDGVLKGLDGFLGGNNNSKGMFTDIAEAAKSIRRLADNLDGRTKEITAGINRFTGPGLREYEALASDGRRTLNDLNRAVRSLEKNPSQLLFGGKPAIPEYKGQ